MSAGRLAPIARRLRGATLPTACVAGSRGGSVPWTAPIFAGLIVRDLPKHWRCAPTSAVARARGRMHHRYLLWGCNCIHQSLSIDRRNARPRAGSVHNNWVQFARIGLLNCDFPVSGHTGLRWPRPPGSMSPCPHASAGVVSARSNSAAKAPSRSPGWPRTPAGRVPRFGRYQAASSAGLSVSQ